MISVVIATYGDRAWEELAWGRAWPSVVDQAKEVIVHHEPDLAIGPARNKAARQAKGDWLCFLDADDELAPDYLEQMEVAIAATKNTFTLFQPSVSYVRKGKPAPPRILPEGDLRHDNFLVVGTVVRHSLFNKVKGFGDYPHGFEDWSLWAKCWKEGARVVPVPEATYFAHVNPRSAHRQLWRNRKHQYELHMRVQRELFPELA